MTINNSEHAIGKTEALNDSNVFARKRKLVENEVGYAVRDEEDIVVKLTKDRIDTSVIADSFGELLQESLKQFKSKDATSFAEKLDAATPTLIIDLKDVEIMSSEAIRKMLVAKATADIQNVSVACQNVSESVQGMMKFVPGFHRAIPNLDLEEPNAGKSVGG